MTVLDSLFEGRSLHVRSLHSGLFELCFDRQGEAVNKLDKRTVGELAEAVERIRGTPEARGVLVTSAKDVFIVGADITEFEALFSLPEQDLATSTLESNRIFTAFETLPVPTVVAINGFALGGGLEMALAADFRVQSTAAQIGLPEVKLGLFPGFGGTVRLPRIADANVAIDWIATGAPFRAEVARDLRVVDAVAEPAELRGIAIQLLERASEDAGLWRERRREKRSPLPLSEEEVRELFATARTRITRQLPKHQPAALAAIQLLERAASHDRDRALQFEAEAFAKIAKTQASDALIQIFLNDQQVKKRARTLAAQAKPVKAAGILGSGIMGGGLACTNASRGIPVRVKDVREPALEAAITEAKRYLGAQVKRGRLTREKSDEAERAIQLQLDYAGFDSLDVVIEAVVEDVAVKRSVLAETERHVRTDTVLASNTSSLRIDDLATGLARPANFVGMHFFNPVPAMPLVEVIQGKESSQSAVATVVGYALAMGKTPIVVRDGPGFLVNRVITPYMQAFSQLVLDGADFVRVDRVMEDFGWPMGPAWLNDVVGLDTGVRVARLIREGFEGRMSLAGPDILLALVEAGLLGQKSGHGFYDYDYGTDAERRTTRTPSPDAAAILARLQIVGPREFTDDEIVERMMLPMLLESAACLDEGVVDSAAELDMALLLGLGFPQYLGGPLKYADWIGARRLIEWSDRHSALGPQYRASESLRLRATVGKRFYGGSKSR